MLGSVLLGGGQPQVPAAAQLTARAAAGLAGASVYDEKRGATLRGDEDMPDAPAVPAAGAGEPPATPAAAAGALRVAGAAGAVAQGADALAHGIARVRLKSEQGPGQPLAPPAAGPAEGLPQAPANAGARSRNASWAACDGPREGHAAWQEASAWLLRTRGDCSVQQVLAALRQELQPLVGAPCAASAEEHGSDRPARPSAPTSTSALAGVGPTPGPAEAFPSAPLLLSPAGGSASSGGAWPALAGCFLSAVVYDPCHAELTLSAGAWRQLEAAERSLTALAASLPGVSSWGCSPISHGALSRLEATALALDGDLEASIAWLEAELRAREPGLVGMSEGGGAAGGSGAGRPGQRAGTAVELMLELPGVQRRTDLAVAACCTA